MNQPMLDRRQFLITAAFSVGGLAIGISPARSSGTVAATQTGPWAPDSSDGKELSAWLEIGTDDTVTIRVPTPEIGNGAMTQVAMNVAEELQCDWSRVRVEYGSILRNQIENGVYSSGFLPFFGGHGTDKVRMKFALQLGASARARLKAAAAARWGVPVSEVIANDRDRKSTRLNSSH